MAKTTVWTTVVSLLAAGPLYAQDVTGDWQGTIKASTDVRLIVRIRRELDGSLRARLIQPDRNPADWGSGVLANAVSLDGSDFRLKVDAVKGNYEGKVSVDGKSISGTWSQGTSVPLELQRATRETAWPDPVQHRSQFVTVDRDVILEVLDWGGSGPPLVFLAGLGNTAHIFDRFAPKLTGQYHVYGITRRGFGASSTPPSGYSADRLGEDVLNVLEFLKLDRPVLVGHSVGGVELSSIGSRHPEKAAGLVYLDAAYGYAFHDPSCPVPGAPPPSPTVASAIQHGIQKYTDIKASALALYAVPKDPVPAGNETPRSEACSKAFERVVPSSRVVRLPGATHYLFISNEAEALKEIRDFVGGLKK